MAVRMGRSFARTRPKSGSRGAVFVRYGVYQNIPPDTARDHFRSRTLSEPPHQTANMCRAAIDEHDDRTLGETLAPIYRVLLRITLDSNHKEILHRCACIDDEEQRPGRDYLNDHTEANRKAWLPHLYRQLAGTIKTLTILEGRAP